MTYDEVYADSEHDYLPALQEAGEPPAHVEAGERPSHPRRNFRPPPLTPRDYRGEDPNGWEPW